MPISNSLTRARPFIPMSRGANLQGWSLVVTAMSQFYCLAAVTKLAVDKDAQPRDQRAMVPTCSMQLVACDIRHAGLD